MRAHAHALIVRPLRTRSGSVATRQTLTLIHDQPLLLIRTSYSRLAHAHPVLGFMRAESLGPLPGEDPPQVSRSPYGGPQRLGSRAPFLANKAVALYLPSR